MLSLPTELLSMRYVPNHKHKIMVDSSYPFYIGASTPDSTYGAFQCCGSQVLHGFNGKLDNQKTKEDLLTLWLRTKGDWLSYYFIASTAQINNVQNKGLNTVLAWLMNELGAKQVDERPNKYHTPNNMHLFVLDLQCNPNIEKFVTSIGKIKGNDGFKPDVRDYQPNWWVKLSEEEQKVYLKDSENFLADWRAKIAGEQAEQEARERVTLAKNFAYNQLHKGNRNYIDLNEVHAYLSKYFDYAIYKTLKQQFEDFLKLPEVKRVDY